jgi:hypothetical protein
MSKIEYKYWPFILLLLFTTCKKDDPVDICIGFEDEVYNYVKYECTVADSLDCSQKILNSLLLPDEYLKCSSTDSLVYTCLSYPYLPYIWLYNSLQIGFDHIMEMFNGFHELFAREDGIRGLIEVYKEMDPMGVNDFSTTIDRGNYMTQFSFLELTLSQFLIISKLTPEETKMLIQYSLDKYYEKSMIPNYTFIGEMSGLALMARILYSHNYEPFMDQLINIPNLSYFIESADLMGINNIEEITQFIVSNTESYLEENK